MNTPICPLRGMSQPPIHMLNADVSEAEADAYVAALRESMKEHPPSPIVVLSDFVNVYKGFECVGSQCAWWSPQAQRVTQHETEPTDVGRCGMMRATGPTWPDPAAQEGTFVAGREGEIIEVTEKGEVNTSRPDLAPGLPQAFIWQEGEPRWLSRDQEHVFLIYDGLMEEYRVYTRPAFDPGGHMEPGVYYGYNAAGPLSWDPTWLWLYIPPAPGDR